MKISLHPKARSSNKNLFLAEDPFPFPLTPFTGNFVNPSPFRSRQKGTDVKSDGLAKRKKNIALNIRLYMSFSLSKRLLYDG